MRVGIFQGPERTESTADSLSAMDRAAGAFAKDSTGLLIMPELFLTGYNIAVDGLRAQGESQDGPSAQAAAAIARAHGVALLYGYPELAADGTLYNAALLLDSDGRKCANFRKLHLYGGMERAAFTAGDEPCVMAELLGIRIGILICYDVEFPEAVRGLALRGADLVAVPTALMKPYEFVPRVLVRARAHENQVFLAYANRCGVEGSLCYPGESCIVGPDGEDLARAGAGETLITAHLDRDLLMKSRKSYPYLRDRRPDLYIGAGLSS